MQDLQNYQPQPYVRLRHPEWSKNAAIYQVNTRQFTAEGTLAAAEKELRRLRDLGASIIYLMPIQPIGEVNRKGSLGSPYAVRDYLAVNPELGTMDDLKRFVSAAHDLGLYVIIDWVANHTAWDNRLRDEHPDWYKQNHRGELQSNTWWDWTDIIELDYRQPALRQYMTEALKFWVVEADIDGYRCDVAGMVPLEFWDNAREELDGIKPVFMLAEWEERDLHARAFDATYGWDWYEMMRHVAAGTSGMGSVFKYYADDESGYPGDAYRMIFLSNHDKNAWEGTEFEVFGDGVEAATVLSVVGTGIPLIYNGQEAGNRRRLAFFERDPIEWREHAMGALYRTLFALKKKYSALWNGAWGAPMIPVPNDAPESVLSFVRANDREKVFVLINLSDSRQLVHCKEPICHGHFQNWFTSERVKLESDSQFQFNPWDYRIFVQTSSHY